MEKGVCFTDLLNDKGRNTDPKWLLEEQQVDVPDSNPTSASDHPRYHPSIVTSIWSALSFGPAGVIPLPLLQCVLFGVKRPWVLDVPPLLFKKKKPCVEKKCSHPMLFSLLHCRKTTGIAAMPNILHLFCHTKADLLENYNLATGFWFGFLLSCITSCYCSA